MRKTLIFSFLLLVFIPGWVHSQGEFPWQTRVANLSLNESLNTPQWVRFLPEKAPNHAEALLGVLREVQALSPEMGFAASNLKKDELGFQHQSLQQTYAGFPVEGGMYRLHLKDGRLVSLNGRWVPGLPAPTVVLSEAQALQKALEVRSADRYLWEIPEEEQLLKALTGDPNATYAPSGELVYVSRGSVDEMEDYRLAYKFDIYASEPFGRADVYIDAATGDLVAELDQIHTADAVGTAYTFHSGWQTITADDSLTDYRLRESGRGGGVRTFNMGGGTNHAAATDFFDSDNVWDSLGLAATTGGSDAHWGAELTYDYFSQKHNRNSFDDQGALMLSYVNFGVSYSNAFWDGTRMTYGGGAGNNNPFSSLDVCGHEFAHGVTQNSAGLIYQNESGALNESFSDIFGTAIEFFGRPSNANWLIGDDIGAFRSMSNPNQFDDPDTYEGDFWFVGAFDNGGVHINSGVQNFWFYLLSVGGAGTNDHGNSYNVTALGMDKAAAIAYRNLTVYLTPGDGYEQAFLYSVQAAIDLYGECSPEMIQTMEAWYAVGVGNRYTGAPQASFVTDDSSFCSYPALVEFDNTSSSGLSYFWDFGDGNTSNAYAPSHQYTAPGTYDVKLVAYGCNSTADSVISFGRIEIDPGQICNVDMPGFSASIVQTGCQGNLFDSGGANNYLDNQNSQVTISPTNAQFVTLTFSLFDYVSGDYIAIYDGPDVQSPLIGYFNNTQPPPTSITSSGPHLTVVESTNGFNNRAGFAASWDCVLVGIEDQQEDLILEVHPNPATSSIKVRIQSEVLLEGGALTVFDAQGREVKRIEGQLSPEMTLSLGDLSQGLYFLNLETQSGRKSVRFVKE